MGLLKSYFVKIINLFKGRNNFLRNREKQTFPTASVNYDKKLVYSLSKSRIPNSTQLKYLKKYLSATELWVLRIAVGLLVISGGFLISRFYLSHLHFSPVLGGEYSEALIGTPKYINPLYANISDVDSDLSHLVFSSLFRRNNDGALVNDLVESYEISPDNKTYTFKIRKDVKWQNGSSLTAEDVLFTFGAIKAAEYKSPLKQSYTGVEIEKIDDYTVKFVLPETYAAFLDTMEFGILPQELWSQIDPKTALLAELNQKPIGSGPYKFKSLTKDKSGMIKSITLIANRDYYLGMPKVEKLTFKFYNDSNEALAALNAGEVNGMSYLPQQLEAGIKNEKQYNMIKLNLPQLTAIFFNEKNNPALAQKDIRYALSFAIDKQKIINDVLVQDARIIDGPILPENFAYNNEIKKYNFDQAKAIELLDKSGWKIVDINKEMVAKAQEDIESKDENIKNKAQEIIDFGEGKWRQKDGKYLTIKLTTVDRGENSAVVDKIKQFWAQVGVNTQIELLPSAQIQAEVIKPRNYEALFYGQVVGWDPDIYAFWHSSQAGEKGMNITNFSNKEADQLLEDARIAIDHKVRTEKYKKLQAIIAEEQPAIFLYSPFYLYLQNKTVNGFAVKTIQLPYDRFNNVVDWFIKIEKKLEF